MKLTRKEAQLQTRQGLLTAAARVFAEHGYHGASVPAIAARAGCTTGAVYSNFRGKEDLFLSLMQQRMEQEAQQRDHLSRAHSTPAERTRATAASWTGLLEARPEEVVLLVEFWLYAVRTPRARTHIASRFAAVRSGLTELIASVTDTRDEAAALATSIQALAYGFALQHVADPQGVPAEAFLTAVQTQLRGAQTADPR